MSVGAAAVAAGAGEVKCSRLRRAVQASTRFFDAHFAFESRRNIVNATVAMALLMGAVSLLLGQDANWDLRNYHLYNGYAWLQGRLLQDFAPAQMQSYFSPVLDVVHYLAMTRLPAPLAGFVFGLWHGLLFLPVSAIAWLALQGQPNRARLAPLLGIAGLCSAAFLSELGGSMADNSTALFVLGSLCMVLHGQSNEQVALRRGLYAVGLAGVLLGIAVALKLTNAIYAVALAMMLLCAPVAFARRVVLLAVLSLSALLVAALLSGWWYWSVFSAFGNPLFPQFNTLFQAPFAAPVSVVDTRWLPASWREHLSWPLLFTFNPKRVSEVSLVQCSWAVLYLLLAVALLRRLFGRAARQPAAAPSMRSVVVFFLVAYLLWQLVFSIHRYLVVLELLMPLLLWWLCRQILPARFSPRWTGGLLVGCAAFSLFGWNTWGQERWAWKGFEVESPSMAAPADSVVLLVGGDAQAWRIPFLDPRARYVGVAGNFPGGEGYARNVADLLAQRGQHFAMVPAPSDRLALRFARMNVWAGRLGLSAQPGCGRLRGLADRVRGLKAVVDASVPGQCRLLPRAGASAEPSLAQRQQEAQSGLQPYGLMLELGSCTRLSSRIGQGSYPYQWCRVIALP